MLELMIERLKRAEELDGIIIATTEKGSDQPIVDLIKRIEDALLFRGPEEDVLARYYKAAVLYKAAVVVRVTSDCPLIEPFVIDKAVRLYREHEKKIDYASNITTRTYPRGLDVEVFSFRALERAYREATLQPDREHVTEYILRHPDIFNIYDVTDDVDRSFMRWTVDTPEDFELITKIYESLYYSNPSFTYNDILQLLDKNPDWNLINAHIQHKPYGQ